MAFPKSRISLQLVAHKTSRSWSSAISLFQGYQLSHTGMIWDAPPKDDMFHLFPWVLGEKSMYSLYVVLFEETSFILLKPSMYIYVGWLNAVVSSKSSRGVCLSHLSMIINVYNECVFICVWVSMYLYIYIGVCLGQLLFTWTVEEMSKSGGREWRTLSHWEDSNPQAI